MMSQKSLSIDTWTAKVQQHAAAVSTYTDAFIERRRVGNTHPIHDFLFTYYNCSPLKLKQWVPSLDVMLETEPQTQEKYPWLTNYWFVANGSRLMLNPEKIQETHRHIARFIATLCTNIMNRPPRFSCFGLHEWAMVYKTPLDEIRHQKHPLRLTPDETAAFVESQTISCSHYDAFRFFTEPAKPLNVLNPTLDTRLEMEQGGCIHANMDIYKWAIKLWPWIGSDFLAKAFFLALQARELDMRASPYDLRDIGYEPICIETEAGRKQYQKAQQELGENARPLRMELLSFCENL